MKQINKMKHTKRWIAVLLCFMLVMTGPIGAFANVTTGSGIGYENGSNSTTGSGLHMGGSNNHKHNSSTSSTSGSSLGLTMQKEKSSDVTTVGSLIWIKSGSNVYKDTSGTNGYKLWISHAIKITEIINGEDNKPEWYKFDFTGTGWGETTILKDYHYVKVANTSQKDPNACDCDNTSENIAEHDETCARRIYIDSLIKDKNANTIYANWESYDEQTKTDILNLAKANYETTYDGLMKLIEADEIDDVVYEEYKGKTNQGIGILISAVKGLFPEGTQITVSDTSVNKYESAIKRLIDGDIQDIVAVDISFSNGNNDSVQPAGNVVVALNIPANKVPDGANMVYIIHIGKNGPEVITAQYLSTVSEGQSISFGTDSFSSYAAVFVAGKYNSQKMSEVLKNDNRYSIATFPVTLFDYDPEQMNNAFRTDVSSTQPFLFRGFGSTVTDTGTGGANNSTAEYAKQGIVQDKLQNGLPVFNFVGDGNGNETTGKYLFDASTSVNGKTVYKDTDFQFIYDNKTGYYQYKSSANHAQYDSNSKTIELYADTLSTQNRYVKTLDLTTANAMNGYSNTSTGDGIFKGTVGATNPSSGGKRFDPYVSFTVPDEGTTDETIGQPASKIKRIYIKAKIPSAVGANKLKVYFKYSDDYYSDTCSFNVDYTPNGDYIEFVIDTSTCDMWTDDKRITALRIDLFDSNTGNSLTDFSQTYEIEISQISLMTYYDNYVTRGGFYPFSKIEDSYPGNSDSFSKTDWETVIEDESTVDVRSSRSMFNPTYTQLSDLSKNLYFGTVMEFDFYIPVDRKVNDKDITYYFNGDDDLWVFIDGTLALDIGGGHGSISGEINLTTGDTWVSNAVTVTEYDTNSGTASKKTGTLDASLMTSGKHTMKIFYMERCGSVSNCFMKFNLPQTPQGSVVVSKAVQDEDENEIDVLKDEEFTFTISAEYNTTGTGTLDTTKGYAYKLVDETNGISDKMTDEKGSFTLTANQTATFDIPENYKVTVTETTPGSEIVKDYQYQSTTVNGTSGNVATTITAKNKSDTFAFVNTYKHMYGEIVLTKTGISDLDHNNNEKQSTIFRITSTTNSAISFDVVIVGNGSKTIKHVPLGTYKITEVTDWSWRYEPGTKEYTVTVGSTGESNRPTVTFTNTRNEDKWLSGDCFAKNYWENGTVARKEDIVEIVPNNADSTNLN